MKQIGLRSLQFLGPHSRSPIAASVLIGTLFFGLSSQAQVQEDGTLSTTVTMPDALNFVISGGDRMGNNLFHSFQTFSIPENGSATFTPDAAIQNVFSRVTGTASSDLQGEIRMTGNGNLFLLNPNGIFLGKQARLNLGGSFIASTAEQILFADQQIFGLPGSSDRGLSFSLSGNLPIGLQFGNTPGAIESRSRASDLGSLAVQADRTLGLVGGAITITGGELVSPGSRLELGSVGPNSRVDLLPVHNGWDLRYDSVQTFADINVVADGSNPSLIATSNIFLDQTKSISPGLIQIESRVLTLVDGSNISTLNLSSEPGGNIEIKTSDRVDLINQSIIDSVNIPFFPTGVAGNIQIQTQHLNLYNGSLVDASSQNDGGGGNLIIEAEESIVLDGNGTFSQIRSNARSRGDAGNINLRTQNLILRNGGQISTSTQTSNLFRLVDQSGQAGDITIEAATLTIQGQGMMISGRQSSGIFAETQGSLTNGDGGSITLRVGNLTLQDRGQISVAALEGSTGQSGALEIIAQDIHLQDPGSAITAESQSPAPAGDLTLRMSRLLVEGGAEVSVNASGQGSAGNLIVEGEEVLVRNGGSLSATTIAGKGNIMIRSQQLHLLNNGSLTTNATQAASGGDIELATNVLTLLRGSDITANAIEGRGGNITILTQGIFLDSTSDITASSEFGLDGVVNITNPEVELAAGLVELGGQIDPATLITPVCPVRGSVAAEELGQFIVTGRGGVPSLPGDIRSVATILRPDDLRSHDLRPDDLRSHDLRSHDLRLHDLRPDDLRLHDLRPDDLRSHDLRPDDLRPDDLRLHDLRPDSLANERVATRFDRFNTGPKTIPEDNGGLRTETNSPLLPPQLDDISEQAGEDDRREAQSWHWDSSGRIILTASPASTPSPAARIASPGCLAHRLIGQF